MKKILGFDDKMRGSKLNNSKMVLCVNGIKLY